MTAVVCYHCIHDDVFDDVDYIVFFPTKVQMQLNLLNYSKVEVA